MQVLQTSITFNYGISREQACILCHLSSECGGCCCKCDKSGGCQGQTCSLPTRDLEGQRWDTWMHLVANYDHIKENARKVIPADLQKKYGINKLIRNHKTTRL